MLPQHHIKKRKRKEKVLLFTHPSPRRQVLPQHHIQSSARTAASAWACRLPPRPPPLPLALPARHRANMLIPLRAARTNCIMCWVWVWVLGACLELLRCYLILCSMLKVIQVFLTHQHPQFGVRNTNPKRHTRPPVAAPTLFVTLSLRLHVSTRRLRCLLPPVCVCVCVCPYIYVCIYIYIYIYTYIYMNTFMSKCV
jgi:hypothetical protein